MIRSKRKYSTKVRQTKYGLMSELPNKQWQVYPGAMKHAYLVDDHVKQFSYWEHAEYPLPLNWYL